MEATIQAGIPLSQLNLHLLDTDTKLILAEKEQALLGKKNRKKVKKKIEKNFFETFLKNICKYSRYYLASHETIKILQMKTHRLEQLLSLKEKRIEELKRKLLDE